MSTFRGQRTDVDAAQGDSLRDVEVKLVLAYWLDSSASFCVISETVPAWMFIPAAAFSMA